METLKPVEVSEYYINRVSKGLSQYFWDNIFEHIFNILKSNTVINSKEDLINAIKSGKVWYEKGAFRTEKRFTNSIARTLEQMGAKYRAGAYYIAQSQIPIDYLNIIALTGARTAAQANSIIRYLGSLALTQIDTSSYINATVDLMFRKLQLDIIKSAQEKQVPVIELGIVKPKVKLPKAQTKNLEQYWEDVDRQTAELNKEIKKAVQKGEDTEELANKLYDLNVNAFKNAPQVEISIDDIELDERSKKIAQDYTYNLNYWVKKWEAKNIIKMREDVLKMVEEGARTPRIQEYFQKRWKVAEDKAHFLAVNESHLAGSVIKSTMYQELGSTKFKWGRSNSKEKRKLHEEYYGEVFSFDDPPIIDEKLGIKGLPRAIWNCKCHMLIIPPSLDEVITKHKEVRNAKKNIFRKIKYTIQNSKQRFNNSWGYRRFGEGQTL